MPKLVISPGSPSTLEFQLKPGVNLLGRGFANDCKIDDPSVSGSHCQITVGESKVSIKDLGSTNGTFINHAPVKEAVLEPGQTIHLGSVMITYHTDTPAGISGGVATAAPLVPPLPVPTNRSVPAPAQAAAVVETPPPPGPIRVSLPSVTARSVQQAPTAQAPPPIALAPRSLPHAPPSIALAPRSLPHAPPAVSAPAVAPEAVTPPEGLPPATGAGPQKCKFHPKTAGRYYCAKCQLAYCELCVTSRPVSGTAHKFCRRCGAECAPMEVQTQTVDRGDNFFSRLPGVFIYPARGSGLLVIVVCTIVIFALGFISNGLFAIFTKVIFLGYLFSFMQNIIHSTAAGDEEMPGFPSFDDLGGCFLRLAGAVIVAFGAWITLSLIAFFSEEGSSSLTSFMMPALIFGCLYFPMALLAVAMKDTPLAANPLIVLPAIIKVPVEYLLAVILLAAVMGLRYVGDPIIHEIFPKELTTKRFDKLFGYLGAKSFWHFAQVYLLAVNMRILGLLYLTKKRKLGWFEH